MAAPGDASGTGLSVPASLPTAARRRLRRRHAGAPAEDSLEDQALEVQQLDPQVPPEDRAVPFLVDHRERLQVPPEHLALPHLVAQRERLRLPPGNLAVPLP